MESSSAQTTFPFLVVSWDRLGDGQGDTNFIEANGSGEHRGDWAR
jgi:hypothetical protein